MCELIDSIRERDPARPTFWEVVFSYPGYHVMGFYRVAHYLWEKDFKGLARWVSHMGRFFTGIEIHPGATIGERLFIDHGMGVVIGETAIIGDDVTLYHGVTLGGRGGTAACKNRHPIIANGAMIGSGAQVLGSVTIGENARVGANAVVVKDVPAGTTAVSSPARIVECENAHPSYGLPEKDAPDPTGQCIEQLMTEIEAIKKSIGLDQAKNDNVKRKTRSRT